MIKGLNHITLSVSDLDRSLAFYCELLGFKRRAVWKNGAYLEAGNIWLALLVDVSTIQTGRADYSHIAFDCDRSSFQQLSNTLANAGYASWQENKSEGDSYYFCDPDGHKLEIHVGDLETRLASMKEEPWAEFKFFDD